MNKNSILSILLSIVFFSCITSNNPVLIKLDNHDIHREELQREFNHFAEYYQNQAAEIITPDFFEEWLTKYINSTLIVNKAKEFGYDKNNKEIQKKLLVVKKYFIQQFRGPYYTEAITNKISVSEAEQNEAIEKIHSGCTVEILKIPDKEKITDIFGNDILLKDYRDFDHACKSAAQHGIFSYELRSRWPYQELPGLKDMLFNMQPDSVTPEPIFAFDTAYKDAYFIIYMKAKETIPLNTGPGSKQAAISLIKAYKAKEMLYSKLRSFFNTSGFEVNYTIIDILYTHIENINNYKIDTSAFKEIINEEILNYQINDSAITVSTGEFITFLNSLPIRYQIQNREKLSEYVMDMVIFDYFLDEAEKSGYTRSEFFVNGVQRQLRNIIEQTYLENEIFSSIHITEKELQEYYRANQSDYTGSEYYIVKIITFANREYASSAKDLIMNTGSHNTAEIKGVVSVSNPEEIRFDNTEYPDYIVSELSSLENGKLSDPFELNNEYVAFLKTGTRGINIIPFAEVKKKMHRSLLIQKQTQKRDELIGNLRNEVKIRIKVNPEKFLEDYVLSELEAADS